MTRCCANSDSVPIRLKAFESVRRFHRKVTTPRSWEVNDDETMTQEPKFPKPTPKTTVARLFFLDAASGRVLSCNPDGTELKTILTEGRKIPDGIVVDSDAGHIYWTNMGVPTANDGAIIRADLDGKISQLLFHQVVHILQNNSSSIRKTANYIGRIARECESCAAISMAPSSKRSSIRARAIRGPGRMQPSGASESLSTRTAATSTGHKKAVTMPARAAFSEPVSKSRKAKIRKIGKTSNFFTTVCLSRLTSISIWPTG